VVLVAFSAPLVEEVVYRGALFTPLEKKFGTVWAIVIVASLFAGVHVQQYWPSFLTIGEIMTLSIILTCIRAFTRSLLPCVAVHFLFNGIQVALPYVFGLLKYLSNH
jgi:membrane protease YdiL (CAAX protease family)